MKRNKKVKQSGKNEGFQLTELIKNGTGIVVEELKWDTETIQKYWKIYSVLAKFSDRYSFFSEKYKKTLLKILKRYIPKNCRCILEVGCGSGIIIRRLNNYINIGLEVTMDYFKDNKHKDFLPVVGCVQRLPFKDSTVDVVYAFEVLEHLSDEDLASTLKEINRCLKSGGLFLFTVPYKEILYSSYVFCPKCNSIFHIHQHQQSFDEEKVKKLLYENGFEILEINIMSIYLKSLNFISRLLREIYYRVTRRQHPTQKLVVIAKKG